jgi:hypothetical protein
MVRTKSASPETSEMTVHAESSPAQTTKSITRRKKEATMPTVANQNQGSVILTEELILAFDPELRSAMITRLVREKSTILQLADQEEQLSRVLEIAKLAAVEDARARGVASARKQQAGKAKKLREQEQKSFIENDLPQLLDNCDYLGFETMKTTVEELAKLVGVVLQWEEESDGEFTCTAKPAKL